MKRCVVCDTEVPEKLTTCTYCGLTVCYNCRDEHELECEDNDDKDSE